MIQALLALVILGSGEPAVQSPSLALRAKYNIAPFDLSHLELAKVHSWFDATDVYDTYSIAFFTLTGMEKLDNPKARTAKVSIVDCVRRGGYELATRALAIDSLKDVAVGRIGELDTFHSQLAQHDAEYQLTHGDFAKKDLIGCVERPEEIRALLPDDHERAIELMFYYSWPVEDVQAGEEGNRLWLRELFALACRGPESGLLERLQGLLRLAVEYYPADIILGGEQGQAAARFVCENVQDVSLRRSLSKSLSVILDQRERGTALWRGLAAALGSTAVFPDYSLRGVLARSQDGSLSWGDLVALSDDELKDDKIAPMIARATAKLASSSPLLRWQRLLLVHVCRKHGPEWCSFEKIYQLVSEDFGDDELLRAFGELIEWFSLSTERDWFGDKFRDKSVGLGRVLLHGHAIVEIMCVTEDSDWDCENALVQLVQSVGNMETWKALRVLKRLRIGVKRSSRPWTRLKASVNSLTKKSEGRDWLPEATRLLVALNQ